MAVDRFAKPPDHTPTHDASQTVSRCGIQLPWPTSPQHEDSSVDKVHKIRGRFVKVNNRDRSPSPLSRIITVEEVTSA